MVMSLRAPEGPGVEDRHVRRPPDTTARGPNFFGRVCDLSPPKPNAIADQCLNVPLAELNCVLVHAEQPCISEQIGPGLATIPVSSDATV